MATHTTTTDDAEAVSVLALHSALRRRGVAAMDGDQANEVVSEHAGRQIAVRYDGEVWVRDVAGTDRNVAVSRSGDEDALARWIANELLGQL